MRTNRQKWILVIAVLLGLLSLAWGWGGGLPEKDQGQQAPVPTIQRASDDQQAAAPGTKAGAANHHEEENLPVVETGQKALPVNEPTSGLGAAAETKADRTPATCTLTVQCTTIFDHLDRFDDRKRQVLPPDGIIYPVTGIVFTPGESVLDVLQREMKKAGIHLETTAVPIYNASYIEGIGNIYELDCGELSGWVYKVNGLVPNYGCSRYLLQDGDRVEVVYTCDLGRDVGGSNFGEERP
ncbi:MAG TPA: DUF4430 domain-containing protein [Syntrophomonas sp.]|nr:DUF4430 domain-containing protein [Syntrophomonas sp.]HRW12872.1 DUF4430 domain-containing protein [Syntrophomonas sp.]